MAKRKKKSQEIDEMRRAADGNFTSAAYEGAYRYNDNIAKNIRPRGRFIDGSQTQN